MKKAVVFDLDGTLLDTLGDLTVAVNYALAMQGFPTWDDEAIREFVGNGVAHLIDQAIPATASPVEKQQCLKAFKKYYRQNIHGTTCPYPGIVELLAALKAGGLKTGVVSNKYEEAVRDLCDLFFPDLIDAAAGDREGFRKKPAPDNLYRVLEQLGVIPEEAVYLGDSDVDVITARNAGTDCIAVLWGFRSRVHLEQAGAECLIAHPAELLGVLAQKE